MTADTFNMRYASRDEWKLMVSDGATDITTTVYDEDVQKVIADRFDYISDTVKMEILERLDNKWDAGEISDEDKDAFIRILEEVVP